MEGTHNLFCLQKAPASTDESSILPLQLLAGALLERTVTERSFILGYLKTTHLLFSQEIIYVLPNQTAALVLTSVINKLIF